MNIEKTLPSRNEIARQDQWDLSPLFAGDADWETAFAKASETLDGYAQYQGHLQDSLDVLLAAIDFDLSVGRAIERLYSFAHLRSDEDKTNQQYLALHQRIMTLSTRAQEASSFMLPEMQMIPDATFQAYIDDPKSALYRFYLQKIRRYKPHTLSPEIEMILAMSGEVGQAPSQFFSQLDNADLKFGSIERRGELEELTHGNFSSFLMDQDREVRKQAFEQYYKTYDAHKHSISAALAYSVKTDLFYSRVRAFPSCRRAALFADQVDDTVYDNLVATVSGNTAPLFTYLDYRRKRLGLDKLHFYDTYVPIISEVRFSMPYEEAVRVCAEALAPLGAEYVSALTEGLLHGWVDRYENRGKRSGAYSSGCYDSPPYILMNYKDDTINSLYTLIHEAGHSMHSLLANRNQPFIYHDYTIFVAEVASTFNEILLSRHLLDTYRDDPVMTAYILNREIDNIRATLYRQTMFAEFEKIIHTDAEEGRPLTLESFTQAYQGLLKKYFGDTLFIDDCLNLECLRIPHFYSAFYVYKYATGISAAIALAGQVLEQGEIARKRYLDFLGLGGSRFPLDELAAAGVDMASPGPIVDAIHHFQGLVDRLIAMGDGAEDKKK